MGGLLEFLLRPLQPTCPRPAQLLLNQRPLFVSHTLPCIRRGYLWSKQELCPQGLGGLLPSRGREAEVTAPTSNPVDTMGFTREGQQGAGLWGHLRRTAMTLGSGCLLIYETEWVVSPAPQPPPESEGTTHVNPLATGLAPVDGAIDVSDRAP